MLDYKSIRARYELAIRDALLPLGQCRCIMTTCKSSRSQKVGRLKSMPLSQLVFRHRPSLISAVVLYLIRGNVQVNMYAPRMGGMMQARANGCCCCLRV